MLYRDPFVFQSEREMVTTDAVRLCTPVLQRGDVMVVEEITCIDHDTANVDVVIELNDGVKYYPLESLIDMGADTYVNAHLKFTIRSGCRICARFMNHSVGDYCKLVVVGYFIVSEPPEF